MAELSKSEIVSLCEKNLKYHDVVNEMQETIDYGSILSFLFDVDVIKVDAQTPPACTAEETTSSYSSDPKDPLHWM